MAKFVWAVAAVIAWAETKSRHAAHAAPVALSDFATFQATLAGDYAATVRFDGVGTPSGTLMGTSSSVDRITVASAAIGNVGGGFFAYDYGAIIAAPVPLPLIAARLAVSGRWDGNGIDAAKITSHRAVEVGVVRRETEPVCPPIRPTLVPETALVNQRTACQRARAASTEGEGL